MGVLHAGVSISIERPRGPSNPASGGERGGDIQCEQLLHVPRPQEAALWNGSKPHGVRARP